MESEDSPMLENKCEEMSEVAAPVMGEGSGTVYSRGRTLFLCFHCATPGSPDEWGSESEELVALSFTCVDSTLNQVITINQALIIYS